LVRVCLTQTELYTLVHAIERDAVTAEVEGRISAADRLSWRSSIVGGASVIRATDVATHLGLTRYPRSWRGRCPCCEYAGSTFSVRAARDGRAQLHYANGCDRDELVAAVARATGQPPPAALVNGAGSASRERKQERALALWRGSEPPAGTLADRYLTARGLPDLASSPSLRFRGDTPHPEGGRLPALIALVQNAAGQPVAVHRTFLTRDGAKALSNLPKRASARSGAPQSSCIRFR
jgi:hypothetical protein